MMPQQLLNFVLFIQLPCAVFVYINAKRRGMDNFWLWVVGTALFMPLFLPFYVLLRPRETYFYCPNCKMRNFFPAESCRHCDLEISRMDNVSVRGEWKLSDAIAIFALSVFTFPISLTGLSVVLGLMERDSKSWGSMFFLSFIGAALIVGLPLWFILKVCGRPLSDAGLARDRLYKNIALGAAMLIPILFVEYAAEEIVVRTSVLIAPSHAEAIRNLQEEEHRQGAELLPQSSNEIMKLIGAAIILIILSPIGEEVLFRGIAYTALKRRQDKWRAMIITSVFFAILHMQLIHFFPIVLSGFILVYLFELTGSLVPSITLHFAYNLALMVFWYIHPSLYT